MKVAWALLATAAGGWLAVRHAGETDTFWFVVGLVPLGLFAVALLAGAWANATWGKGV